MSEVVFVSLEEYTSYFAKRREEGYTFLADLTAVDYLEAGHPGLPAEVRPERFEVVVNIRRFDQPSLLRVRTQVPAESPWVPSLVDLYPGAEAMEREAYDLLGIGFEGHPDLTRILLPEDWEGYPLRKDYGLGRVPVQFKEVRRHR